MAIIKTKFNRGIEGATNIVDAGTEGTKVASGTTAQRGSTAGQFRFNSTTGLAEYYTGTVFKSIDAPPTVTSIDVTEVSSDGGGNQTIVITGSGFGSGATVSFVGSSASFNASTTTVDSLTQITAVAPKSSFLNAQEPYSVKVLNTSGLSGILAGQINVDNSPSWSTASGSLGTFNNYATVNVSATATDPDGDTIAYSIQSGSLPTGLSLNSGTGAITGTVGAVSSATTSNFTLRATANTKTTDRAFSIVAQPVIQAFTSSGTWTVPSGVTQVGILVVAGGGAGGTTNYNPTPLRGAGGGAGGLIYIPSWNVTGSSSYAITIGNGGTVSANSATNGQNSTVVGSTKTLTALGGGHGGFGDNTNNGSSGGSGGSPWYPTYSGYAATQPTNSSDGVTTYNSTGYGNAGGNSNSSPPYGGGGGGATSRGEHYNEGQRGGTGFNGNTYGLGSYGESGYFASGGTSASHPGTNTNTTIGGGGAAYNDSSNTPSNSLANGQANTGGGGGSGGNGGSGVIIFIY